MDQNYKNRRVNESQPWLIKTSAPDEAWKSTTHATYISPRNDLQKKEGRRKQLLRQFLWQEMVAEAAREMNKPNPVEEYNSEYDKSFGVPDFVPSMDNIPKESELHKKYPLYAGSPISFWQGNLAHLEGVTRSVDPLMPFKKNSAFTKPWQEILDEPIKPL